MLLSIRNARRSDLCYNWLKESLIYGLPQNHTLCKCSTTEPHSQLGKCWNLKGLHTWRLYLASSAWKEETDYSTIKGTSLQCPVTQSVCKPEWSLPRRCIHSMWWQGSLLMWERSGCIFYIVNLLALSVQIQNPGVVKIIEHMFSVFIHSSCFLNSSLHYTRETRISSY